MAANRPAGDIVAAGSLDDIFVFDALSLFYCLEDRYAAQVLEAGVNAMNVTFATEESWDDTQRALESGLARIAKSPYLTLATNVAEIEQARRIGKVAVIPGTQGSRMLEYDISRLDAMYEAGIRFLGLAYTGPTLFADGCGERRNAGLSTYGEELIAAVNEKPIMLDLSHCGHKTRSEAVLLARAPVCTHSNAFSVNANDRNTKDEVAKAIALKGGVMGVCCLPKSVRPATPTIDDVITHHRHYINLVGEDHVGLGLDFTDGLRATGKPFSAGTVRWRTLRPDIFGTPEEFFTMSYPDGFASIGDLPNFTRALFESGYSGETIAKTMGGNWLAAFERFVG
jgi:membrane dipeptidase